MTAASTPRTTPPARSALVWGVLRVLVSLAVLLAVYFLAPLDGLRMVPLGITLASACALLVGIGIWQVGSIARSDHPRLRGAEALGVTVGLYVLLFAAIYFAMAIQDPSSFTGTPLTRVDTLYFTVTTFSSVGFGDISPVSQTARLTVTIQMVLNLLVLGAGIRVFVGTARRHYELRNTRSPALETDDDA